MTRWQKYTRMLVPEVLVLFLLVELAIGILTTPYWVWWFIWG